MIFYLVKTKTKKKKLKTKYFSLTSGKKNANTTYYTQDFIIEPPTNKCTDGKKEKSLLHIKLLKGFIAIR